MDRNRILVEKLTTSQKIIDLLIDILNAFMASMRTTL